MLSSPDYTHDVGVLGELFSTLSKLAVRDEFCKEVMDLGGLKLILLTLQENLKHQVTTSYCFSF